MRFLLDSDICSYYLKGNRGIMTRMTMHTLAVGVSIITVAELYTWVNLKKTAEKHRKGVEELLAAVPVIGISREVAERAGIIRAGLREQGRPYPGMDMLIAATALVHDFTLVTHNVSDYADVPGLQVADWTTT